MIDLKLQIYLMLQSFGFVSIILLLDYSEQLQFLNFPFLFNIDLLLQDHLDWLLK
jgi:hypothetical protein